MAKLLSIVYKPVHAPVTNAGYTRVALPEATLIAEYGIDGDLKGGGTRQINVMTAETAVCLGEEGFSAGPGLLGEQLMVAGLDVDALTPGDRIMIGDSAVIEISEPRTGCSKFERHQGKSRTEAAGRLGMMARVVAGGTIAVGDEVRAC